jgi:hypothetical protein
MLFLTLVDRVRVWSCASCSEFDQTLDPLSLRDELLFFLWMATYPALAVLVTLAAPATLSTLVWVTCIMEIGIALWVRATKSAFRYKTVPTANLDPLDWLLVHYGTALEIMGGCLGFAIVAVPGVYALMGNRPFESSWIPLAVISVAAAQVLRSLASVLRP